MFTISIWEADYSKELIGRFIFADICIRPWWLADIVLAILGFVPYRTKKGAVLCLHFLHHSNNHIRDFNEGLTKVL